MTTPKKKHLIELMIEANVKWPDDAKYAAQDKNQEPSNDETDLVNIVSFYLSKPTKECNDTYWYGDHDSDEDVKLPSLCRNWHQTIVTREQYAEAVAVSGNGEQEQQTHSGEADVIPSESIESLLAEIKAKREEHTALVTKSEVIALEITSVEQQVNGKLKQYGFVISPLAAQSEPVDEPWKIGDKCIVSESPCAQSLIGKECVLTNINSGDRNLPYRVEFRNGDNYWVRDIRRP